MSYTPTTEEVREIYRGCLVQTDTNIYSFVDEAQADGEFDRWLAKRDQKLMAQAWDRGYEAGLTDFASSMTINPYRQGETE